MLNRRYEMAEFPRKKKVKWHADVYTQKIETLGSKNAGGASLDINAGGGGLVLRLMKKPLTDRSTMGV